MEEDRRADETASGGKETETSSVPETNNRIICGVIGFSLYWAWFYLTCFSDVVVLPIPVELHIEPLYRCVAFFSTSFVLFCVLCARRWILSKWSNAAMVLIPVVLSVGLYLLTASVSGIDQLNLPLEIIAWFSFGAAYALVSLQAGQFFATIKEKDSLFFIGISASLGALIYITIDMFEGQSALFITMILPLLATVLFLSARVLSHDAGEKEEASQERQSIVQWIKDSEEIMPFQLLFGVAFGFAIGVAISLGMDDFGHFSWVIIIAFCLPGPVLLILFFLGPRSLLQSSTKWILPLMTIMLLPLPFVDYYLRIICCALLVFGFVWYDLVHLNTVTGLMQAQKDSALAIYCSRRMFIMFGIFIGHVLSWLLLVFSGFSGQLFSLSVIVIAALMILIIPLVSSEKTQDTVIVMVDKNRGSGRALEDVCKEICEGARLSPRQTEIFSYLAKGRNAAFIENELVVSNHTVKAHIYRIYQKLGIHSQQELIDLVDNMMPKADPCK